jgi:DNA-binding NarL/FixJ family response regulator
MRVLIADDHPLFRDGLRGLLEAEPDIEVVGEAASGEDIVALVATHLPDVVLMDIAMPGINGITATRQIIDMNPQVNVLMVTMIEDDDSVFAAMQAGACGYLLKGANRIEILRAIHAAANGEAIFGPGIARRLMKFFASPKLSTAVHPFPELTVRESEILALIAQGRSNAEIAHDLSLSLKTIQNYVSTIFNKLQVADRGQAVVRARDAGLA